MSLHNNEQQTELQPTRLGSVLNPYECYVDTHSPVSSPGHPRSPPPGYSSQNTRRPTTPQSISELTNQVSKIRMSQSSYTDSAEYYAPHLYPRASYHSAQVLYSEPSQPDHRMSGSFPTYPPQTQNRQSVCGGFQPGMQSIYQPEPHGYVVHEKSLPPGPSHMHMPKHYSMHDAPIPGPPNQIVQQPRAQADMVIRGNRNVLGKPYGPDGLRDWSYGLCGCCEDNPDICCLAACCPCVVYGKNKARLEHLSAHDSPHPHGGGSTCSGDCALHACLTTLCLFGWALQISGRATIRQRYKIEGDWCGDCMTALCCSSCELARESREIALEENSFPRGVGSSTGEWYNRPREVGKEKIMK